MTAFLHQVADALLRTHGPRLHGVAVVLPSQRAGLYLRKWLAEIAGKPLWSPQLYTIGGFMEALSGLRALPTEELLFEAYEAYRTAEGEKARPIGDFLQWAGTAVADISEADAHLVPLDIFYRDLRAWDEIGWTFNDDPLSQGQKRMVDYWAMVGRMHTALNARLQARGAGTTGAIERAAVAGAGREDLPWNTVWFAGLNALTLAQQAVLRRLQNRDMARLAWDGDRYYMDRPEQEAGRYLRGNLAAFGPGEVPMGNNLQEGALQLRSVSAPNDVAQAWCAAELLRRSDPGELARTAVVLADESLLQPLLEALPANIGPLNITMGLPVARSSVGAYLDALHRLHAGRKPGAGFFHQDVDRLLSHPFLQQGPWAGAVRQAVQDIRTLRRAWLPPATLRDKLDAAQLPAHAIGVFAEVEDVRTQMPEVTGNALAWAMECVRKDAFATEQVFQASVVLHRVHGLMAKHAHQLDLNAYADLFRRLLGQVRIGLFGEPLAGLQVMGMLEARALDPERVIVLGAQEGILPENKAGRSFIPFELRRANNMPLRDGDDAVQAYNFLRMLQRAREAVAVWPEGEGSGGPSRFLLQLEHELFRERQRPVEHAAARIPMPRAGTATIGVAKSGAVLGALRSKLEKGLSPSAIGDWLRCPLDFYFKQLLRLREVDEVEARIAPNVLGDALHAALETIYRPLLGRPLQAPDLEAAVREVGALVRTNLQAEQTADGLAHGQPLLQVHMAEHAARRFLRNELQNVRNGAVITPLQLEAEMGFPLQEAALALGSPVRVMGRLDRVDQVEGMHRILDLKSGKVNPADLVLKELDRDALTAAKRYAVQLLVYAWLYLSDHPGEGAVQAGILPLQHAASSEPLFLKIGDRATVQRDDLPAIGSLLTTIVREMTDPAQVLAHDPESRYCAFCFQGK
jgi:RecB family exonuclease